MQFFPIYRITMTEHIDLVWSTLRVCSVRNVVRQKTISSCHRDDLEVWEVDEIKTETVARITKLATDVYIQQHNNL